MSKHTLSYLVLALTILFAAPLNAGIDFYKRAKPHVNISTFGQVGPSDDTDQAFDFKAEVRLFPSGLADGAIHYLDDSVRKTYRVIAGWIGEGQNAGSYVIMALSEDGALDRNSQPDVLLATVHKSASDPNLLNWGIHSGDVPNGALFALPSKLEWERRIRRGDDLPLSGPRILQHYPQQEILPEGSDERLGFQARVRVDRNHRATGAVEFFPPEERETIRFDALLGVPLRDPDEIVGMVIIIVLHGKPVTIRNLVLAVVRPNNNNGGGDDCDLWDLVGPQVSGASINRLRFDAFGQTRIGRH